MKLARRDKLTYCRQILGLLKNKSDELRAAGFNIDRRLEAVEKSYRKMKEVERERELARARALQMTHLWNKALDDAYADLSGLAESFRAALGFQHPLVKVIRRMRPNLAPRRRKSKA